jgi:hypothetical protein
VAPVAAEHDKRFLATIFLKWEVEVEVHYRLLLELELY